MSWIDFRKLRDSLSFEQILQHYQVHLKIGNGKATGPCPLPGHQGEKRSASFSAQLDKGLFQCFSCHAKGNVLDFACLMEGKNPRVGADIHDVALKLQKQFLGDNGNLHARREPPRQQSPRQPELYPQKALPASTATAKPSLPVVVNAPLDFELKELDPEHPYLKERGFNSETIEHFGLGYCNRGSFKGRVVIPLHDAEARFIGYAGRIMDDKLISDRCPKYKFPSPREHEGKIHKLHKTLFLYNGHRITEAVDDLIVVEGFPSVWWLWQNGYPNAVSVMGSSCSIEQATLIAKLVKPDGRVWVFSDGDEGGKQLCQSISPPVASERWLRVIRFADGKQPTDLTVQELAATLTFGATKSGTSKKPRVANSRKSSNVKPSDSMAARE